MIIAAFLAFGVAVYLFIRLILKRDKGNKEPTGALYAAMGYGVLAIVLAGILNYLLIPPEVQNSIGATGPPSVPTSTLLFSAFGVGAIEESLKTIPLALFIYKRRYFNELTDGVIYFGIVALTFGILEDILYTVEFGGAVGIMRILLSPYLHVGFTALFGVCLIYKKVFNRSWLIVGAGFLAAILIHGVYDFFVLKGGVVGVVCMFALTLSLNIMLFVLFRRVQRIDERHGRSAVGINNFCRHCGRPNPQRLLYCSFCGRLS